MGKPIALFLALYVALAVLTGPALAEDTTPDRAGCAGLQNLEPDAFSRLAEKLEAEHRSGSATIAGRLATCGLDYQTLRERQCRRAYDRQNLEFLLSHCREEAWSLARAQCERNLDSISPRYAAFCRAFGRE